MRKAIGTFLSFIFLLFFQKAHADFDHFGTGNGQHGSLTVTTTNKVVNLYGSVLTNLSQGNLTINVNSATGFSTGQLIMIWQCTGLTAIPASGDQSSLDLSSSPVGRWEFARIASVSGNTITMTAPLIYSYAANYTQVIFIPEYTSVTINSGCSITAQPWNGLTGGFAGFLASGTVTISGFTGSINANGSGFRGGIYVDDNSGIFAASGYDEPATAGAQKGEGIVFSRYGVNQTGRGNVANGGGGGVAYLSGGGGGSNAGLGGKGGNSDPSDGGRPVGGLGGSPLTFTPLDHLFMGGGGGAGHGVAGTGQNGGAGGGVVFVRCGALSGTGGIRATGSAAATTSNDAGSGGGAGGTIYMRTSGTLSTTVSFSAAGGTGGTTNNPNTGPGGGGGGGRILLQACSIGSNSINDNGGNSGVESGATAYGASAGSMGTYTAMPSCMTIPADPVITSPSNGSVMSDLPNIYGTGPASTQINIYLDGTLLTNVTTDASGNYTYTPTTSLSNGSHTVTTYAVQQALYSNAVNSTFTTSNTLPVKLISFTAQKKGKEVLLQWTTATETNSDHFSIECSADGTHYSTLAIIRSKTIDGASYQYDDTRLIQGVQYYRLTETDKNGRTTIYATRVIQAETRNISIHPNPVTSIVIVDMANEAVDRIQLLDANGSMLEDKKIGRGQLSVSLNVAHFSIGTYYIRIFKEDQIQTISFVKL